MTDHVSIEKRSEIMRAVHCKNTKPEILVRKLVYSMGYRYRLHSKELPGKPDLVFPGRRKVIFVHGCFWHGHKCSKGNAPKSNQDYWLPKLKENRVRDAQTKKRLKALGWDSIVIWQCQLKRTDLVQQRIMKFLG